ncbi:MAG: adenosylcobinamide-GDP ribazoletransferase [Cyanobacteriota bacterium]|nr:adenosylcobinamide-GDP ribazoletransferase [Cyanobacteriota bacterium]
MTLDGWLSPPLGRARVVWFRSSPATPSFPPSWLQDLAGAWMFYSVLPPWPGIRPRFERIARFAPWMGLLIGSLQSLLWGLLQGHVPLLAQVCGALAAGLWLTGGLHMDGAMDTADGLAAGERALEAMQDSRVGASGAQTLAMLLLLKAAALATLQAAAPLALVWAALWGRMAPLLAVAWFPYLHPQGSAGFHRRHWAGLLREARPGLLAVVALLWLSMAQGWGAAGLAGALPALLVPRWLGRRLGGHSGDSYGACVEWTEGMALVLMALVRIAPSGPAG